jgi:hypothetical protein
MPFCCIDRILANGLGHGIGEQVTSFWTLYRSGTPKKVIIAKLKTFSEKANYSGMKFYSGMILLY